MDYGYLNDLQAIHGHSLDLAGVVDRSRTETGKNSYSKLYLENEEQDILYRDLHGGATVYQTPLEFGRLAHPNGDGLFRFRFFRGTNHGYARANEAVFECAKYNQRLNPRLDRVANLMVGNTSYRPTKEDMVAATLAHFPRVGGLITSAPFKSSKYGFKLPEATQPTLFTDVFGVTELAEMILDSLFASREALSHLSRTSQYCFKLLEANFTHLAVNTQDFGLLNMTYEEQTKLVEDGEITQEERQAIKAPRYAIFTPVRGDIRLAKDAVGFAESFFPPRVCPVDAPTGNQDYKKLFNKNGFRTFVGYDYHGSQRKPSREILGFRQMLKSIHLHFADVQNVTFERVPFLDAKTVEVILENMPNLKNLGIYSCELIHLGSVSEIVDAVGQVNKSRIQGRMRTIELDIAPQFRQGPIKERAGSYGITFSDPSIWNDFGTDTGRALTANLVSLARKARGAHVDLFTPGKAFRMWLDKLPLHINQVTSIVEAVANFLDYQRDGQKMVDKFFKESPIDGSLTKKQLLDSIADTVRMDLVIAATAKPLKQSDFLRERPMLCQGCHETLPGAFFRAEVHSRHPDNFRCEGCELVSQLEGEDDNCKTWKRHISWKLWRDVLAKHHHDSECLDFLFGGSDEAESLWADMVRMTRQIPSKKSLLAALAKFEHEKDQIHDDMDLIWDYRVKRPLVKALDNIEKQVTEIRVQLGSQARPNACRGTVYDWDFLRKAYVLLGQIQGGHFTIDGPYNMNTLESYLEAFCMNN